jgi:hypothetical protein
MLDYFSLFTAEFLEKTAKEMGFIKRNQIINSRDHLQVCNVFMKIRPK